MSDFIKKVREERAADLTAKQTSEIDSNRHRSVIAIVISGGSLIVAIISLIVAILK